MLFPKCEKYHWKDKKNGLISEDNVLNSATCRLDTEERFLGVGAGGAAVRVGTHRVQKS